MTQTATAETTPAIDLIDSLADIAPGTPLDLLRRERPLARDYAQSCHDVIFAAPAGHGVTAIERHAIGLRVAALSDAAGVAAHHRQALEDGGAPRARIAAIEAGGPFADGDRLGVILRHADLLTLSPVAATPGHLRALARAGLSAQDIVVVSQVVGFVTYQVRLLAGLDLIAGRARPVGPDAVEAVLPADLQAGFTLDELDWRAWLPPVALDEASALQREVVKEAWPGAEKSEFFTLLVREPDILRHRMKLLNAIMYAPRGLPRAERELGATAESKINGCPYCASAHGRLYVQLAKEDATIKAIFENRVDAAGLTGRAAAIVRYAVALTPSPQAATLAHIADLRGHGLSDTQLLDLTQAVAIFAWANRLMQTLGEPLSPAA